MSAAASSKLSTFMNHPAGPKTVFFWAPVTKWGLTAASVSDLRKPVDKISVNQTFALAATGFIWVRYSFVINPVNYSLATVNFLVGLANAGQLARIAKHRYNLNQRTKD